MRGIKGLLLVTQQSWHSRFAGRRQRHVNARLTLAGPLERCQKSAFPWDGKRLIWFAPHCKWLCEEVRAAPCPQEECAAGRGYRGTWSGADGFPCGVSLLYTLFVPLGQSLLL